MALLDYSTWTDEDLVAECERLCVAMTESETNAARDRAIDELIKIRGTLIARGADSLRKLLPLLNSDEPQCRLEAAVTCEALDPVPTLAVLRALATAPETRATHAGIDAWIRLLLTNPEFRATVSAQMDHAYGALFPGGHVDPDR